MHSPVLKMSTQSTNATNNNTKSLSQLRVIVCWYGRVQRKVARRTNPPTTKRCFIVHICAAAAVLWWLLLLLRWLRRDPGKCWITLLLLQLRTISCVLIVKCVIHLTQFNHLLLQICNFPLQHLIFVHQLIRRCRTNHTSAVVAVITETLPI